MLLERKLICYSSAERHIYYGDQVHALFCSHMCSFMLLHFCCMEVKNGIVHLSLNKNKELEHLIDCVTLTYSNLVGEKYKVTIIVVTSDFV